MTPKVTWVGQDNNRYIQDDSGTKNLGTATAEGSAYWLSQGYKGVTDPAVPTASSLQNINQFDSAGSGGILGMGTTAPANTSGTSRVFNQAGASNTQRTIDELPGLLEAALQAERQKYQNTTGELNSQETGQRDVYGKSTVTNQQNYDGNFMDSIRAGIKGLGGLMSLLRGTGAGGGTAEEQARDAVGGVTANDIRTGADTQKENQGQLDTSLSTFLSELGTKRRMNEDTRVNNERAVRRDNSTQMQDLFGKMAGFYGDAGNTGEATNWMNRAGSLTPEIAANSRTQVSAYDSAPVAVKAPELTAFAGPTQPSVTTSPSGQVGSGIFTMNERRRRETPVGV